LKNLSENTLKTVKEIIFFSDATCSQNRCWTVARFCSFIAITFNLKVVQIFPVRGHSFSICDTNFAILGRKIKSVEKIEIPEQYINYLNEQKKFKVKHGKVFDFENFLKPYFAQKHDLKISKAVKIIYNSNGDISMQQSYNESNQIFVNLLKCDKEVIKNLNLSKIPKLFNVQIKTNKKQDILSLMQYLLSDNQKFYVNYLNKNCEIESNDSISDSSDDQYCLIIFRMKKILFVNLVKLTFSRPT
jgi:hypothetical protein